MARQATIRAISLMVLSQAALSVSLAVDTAPSEARCESAQRLSDSGVSSEQAVLGDCYYYGVHVEQNYEDARYYYLQSVLNGSTYGKLRLGTHQLFQAEGRFDRSLGFYFLRDLAEGDGNDYRAYARYYLGVFYANRNQRDEALEYFRMAIDDGSLDARYAKAYTEVLAGLASVDEITHRFQQSNSEDQPIDSAVELTLSCWIAFQPGRTVSFRTEDLIDERVFGQFGGCDW